MTTHRSLVPLQLALNAKQARLGVGSAVLAADAPRVARVASASLGAELSRFLDRHFAADEVAEFKRVKGEDPQTWAEPLSGPAPSEADVLRIRHLVRFWVSYDANREDITQRLLDMQDKLAPFRPSSPVQVFRNEKLEGEDGWDQQYAFASAWSTSLEAAKAFEGEQQRRLVTALALPEDILVSVPVVDAWARVYDLGLVDAEEDDEVVVIPHPSFEHDREEVKAEPEPKAKEAAEEIKVRYSLSVVTITIGQSEVAAHVLPERSQAIVGNLWADQKGTGIGTRLMLALCDWCKAHDIQFITGSDASAHGESTKIRQKLPGKTVLFRNKHEDDTTTPSGADIWPGAPEAMKKVLQSVTPDPAGRIMVTKLAAMLQGLSKQAALGDLGQPKHAKLLQPKLAALPDLQPMMQEFLTVLDPEGKCALPKIGYVSNSSNTLGLCHTSSLNVNQGIVTGANSAITLQKGLAVDLNHLRKVVAHEVCHHVAIHAMVLGKPLEQAQDAVAAIGDGHGPFWQAEAEKINQRYGEGFVTQFSDMNTLEWEVRPAYLFIMQIPSRPRPVYCWAPTVSSKIIMTMAEYVRESLATAYVVKTTNRFVTQPGAKAPDWSSPVTAQETEALQAAIAGAKGDGNLFNSFIDGERKTRQAPGRPWTLVLINPKRGATGEPAVVNAWALGRKLNDQELEQLKQVREAGIEFRRLTMPGTDDLRDMMPKLNLNDVIYNPGRVSPDVYEVQTYLKWLWNNTVTGRSAKLLQPKRAAASFTIPPKLAPHVQATGSLDSVAQWHTKVWLGNSGTRDHTEVNALAFDPATGTVVPIAGSDEHQNGWELIQFLERKKLIPHLPWVILFLSLNFVDPQDVEGTQKQLADFKAWRRMGGPNTTVRSRYIDPGFLVSMDEFIQANGVISPNRTGALSALGQQLVKALEELTRLYTQQASGHPVADRALIRAGRAVMQAFGHVGNAYLLSYAKLQEAKTALGNLEAGEDRGEFEQAIFGADGLKNQVHIALRGYGGGNQLKDRDLQETFGNPELAKQEFDRLGAAPKTSGLSLSQVVKRVGHSEAAYQALGQLADTFQTGGCWTFAEALHRALPGSKLEVLASKRWAAEHVVVNVGGRLYDSDGGFSPEQMVKKFSDEWELEVQLMPFHVDKATQAGFVFDETAVKALTELFVAALGKAKLASPLKLPDGLVEEIAAQLARQGIEYLQKALAKGAVQLSQVGDEWRRWNQIAMVYRDTVPVQENALARFKGGINYDLVIASKENIKDSLVTEGERRSKTENGVTSNVVVTIALNPTRSVADAIAELGDPSSEGFRSLVAMLSHEITHVFGHRYPKAKPIPQERDWNLEAYANHPTELDAFTQEMVSRAMQNPAVQADAATVQQAVEQVLREPRWTSIGSRLTEPNRRRILREVYLAVAKAKQRPKAAKLLQPKIARPIQVPEALTREVRSALLTALAETARSTSPKQWVALMASPPIGVSALVDAFPYLQRAVPEIADKMGPGPLQVILRLRRDDPSDTPGHFDALHRQIVVNVFGDTSREEAVSLPLSVKSYVMDTLIHEFAHVFQCAFQGIGPFMAHTPSPTDRDEGKAYGAELADLFTSALEQDSELTPEEFIHGYEGFPRVTRELGPGSTRYVIRDLGYVYSDFLDKHPEVADRRRKKVLGSDCNVHQAPRVVPVKAKLLRPKVASTGPRVWIDPQGKVFDTNHAPHEDWALAYLDRLAPGEWTGGAPDMAQAALLGEGWARAGSMANLLGPIVYGEAARWTPATFRAFQGIVSANPSWQTKQVELGIYPAQAQQFTLDEFLAANKPTDLIRTGRQASAEPTMGFNVNDNPVPWTDLILAGKKTIETRDSPSLSPHIGERVGIVSTHPRGVPALVAYCVLGEPIVYTTNEQFRADNAKHQVPGGPEWDLQPGAVKYGYPITDLEPCEPMIIRSQGRVWRKLAAGNDSAVMEPPDVAKLVEQADRELPLQALQRVDPTSTPQFKAWFGRSAVVNPSGSPKVVYHGSTHEFDRFDPTIGNDEGFYGKGLYFTDSKVDVNANYASQSGPDLTQRIEMRAEEILHQLEEDAGHSFDWGTEEQKAAKAKAEELARKEIAGSSLGMVYLTYLRILKPVIVQPSGGTQFEGGHWDPRDEDNYIESRQHVKLYESTRAACEELGCDGDDVWGAVNEQVDTYEGYTAYEFEQAVRGCQETCDIEGGAGPLLSRIWQLMGFDGVIMDADAQFSHKGKGMEMPPGTRHYIIWNPRQVKSALGNAGTFNPRSPRLTAKLLQPKLAGNTWQAPSYEQVQWIGCSLKAYQKAKARLMNLTFPLTLYRAVRLKSEAELRTHQAGVFWTDQLDRAQFYTPAGRQAPGEKFILRTEVASHMIDWDSTFAANCEPQGRTGTREQEIKLHQGAPVNINGILGPGDTEFQPRSVRVTASGPVTTNASGAPIHETAEGIANFWRWFGASKTVDGTGQPMVFHHGTPTGGFDAFSPEALGSNTGSASSKMGFFFTPDLDAAKHYAQMTDPLGTALWQLWDKMKVELGRQGLTGKIYTGYSEGSLFMAGDWRSQLSKQPTADEVKQALIGAMRGRLEVYERLAQQFKDDVTRKAKPKKWELAAVEKATKSMADAGRTLQAIEQALSRVSEFKPDWGPREIKDVYLKMLNPLVEDHQGRRLGRSFAEVISDAKEAGHDGAVILNTEDPKPMDVYIVFEPTQIKGVENSGSFDQGDARLVASQQLSSDEGARVRKRAKLLQPKDPVCTRIIHLDLDGVTADYLRGAREAGVAPDEFLNLPGAFRHLELMPGAKEAIAKLQRIAPGRVKFLSKPADERWKESCVEKREWVAEHFPSIPPEHVLLVMDKGAVGQPGDLLLDDHPEWAGADQFKGTVIRFTGPHCWQKVFDAVERGNARLPRAINQ